MEAKRRGGGFIRTHHIHGQPRHERSSALTTAKVPRADRQAQQCVAGVERHVDAEQCQVVVELEAEQRHAGHLQALRSAQHVIDFEKGLEQDAERDGHQRQHSGHVSAAPARSAASR